MSQSRFAPTRITKSQLANISFDDFFDAKIEAFLSRKSPNHAAAVGATAVNPREPQWIIEKYKCKSSFDGCFGQLNKFLASFLAKVSDFAEQIAVKLDDSKAQQIKDIFDYFSGDYISDEHFKTELQKELKVLRTKSTSKIYRVMQKNKGCIFTKRGELIPCRFDPATRKYVAITSKGCKIHRFDYVNWRIPASLKSDGFIIIAFDDPQKRKIIQKWTFDPLRMTLLHIGRRH